MYVLWHVLTYVTDETQDGIYKAKYSEMCTLSPSIWKELRSYQWHCYGIILNWCYHVCTNYTMRTVFFLY